MRPEVARNLGCISESTTGGLKGLVYNKHNTQKVLEYNKTSNKFNPVHVILNDPMFVIVE